MGVVSSILLNIQLSSGLGLNLGLLRTTGPVLTRSSLRRSLGLVAIRQCIVSPLPKLCLAKAFPDQSLAHLGLDLVEQLDDILHFLATSLLGLLLALSRLP